MACSAARQRRTRPAWALSGAICRSEAAAASSTSGASSAGANAAPNGAAGANVAAWRAKRSGHGAAAYRGGEARAACEPGLAPMATTRPEQLVTSAHRTTTALARRQCRRHVRLRAPDRVSSRVERFAPRMRKASSRGVDACLPQGRSVRLEHSCQQQGCQWAMRAPHAPGRHCRCPGRP